MLKQLSLIVLAALASCAIGARGQNSVHTVITTECGQYFIWQSLGMLYSHRKSGQPGPLTRIVCCGQEEWAAMPEEAKTMMTTHVAPSFTYHPRNGDVYSAYNKPVAVIDWLARANVTEDFVLVIDADMIMRSPFDPRALGARPGWAVAAYFGYMMGTYNALADKHIPEIPRRNDTLAGQAGRRSDMVGGFTLMATADLRRVGPLWLKYTEDVRFDCDAFNLTGDAYTEKPCERPWISEMYGYSYACAKSNVWHNTDRWAMLYPGYSTHVPPKVLHYGLIYKVPASAYEFDKHWHFQFDALKCPPWGLDDLKEAKDADGGLFPHPPHPASFKTRGQDLLRDLLSVEVPITLNAAFCERHRAKCPPSEELERECGRAEEAEAALAARLAEVEAGLPDPCHDDDERCGQWRDNGECEKNNWFMTTNCPLACGVCTPRGGKVAPRRAAADGGGGGHKKKALPPPVEAEEEAEEEVEEEEEPAEQEEAAEEGEQAAGDGGDGSDAAGDGSVAEADVADAQARQDVKEKRMRHRRAPKPVRRRGGGDAGRAESAEDGFTEEAAGEVATVDGEAEIELESAKRASGERGVGVGVGGAGDGTAAAAADADAAESSADRTGLAIPYLKLRCTRFPDWSAVQVKRCMDMASSGAAYDPAVDDSEEERAAAAAAAGGRTATTEGIGVRLGSLRGVGAWALGGDGGAAAAAAAWASGKLALAGAAALAAVALLAVHYSRQKKKYGAGYRVWRHLFHAGRAEERDD